jgi:hypothetical protein
MSHPPKPLDHGFSPKYIIYKKIFTGGLISLPSHHRVCSVSPLFCKISLTINQSDHFKRLPLFSWAYNLVNVIIKTFLVDYCLFESQYKTLKSKNRVYIYKEKEKI